MQDLDSSSPVSSEAAFFIEAQEVLQLISNLCISASNKDDDEEEETVAPLTTTTDNANDNSKLIGDESLARLRVIFDKYLECPTLLDSHLERILTTLSKNAVGIAHAVYDAHARTIQECHDHGHASTVEISNENEDENGNEKEEQIQIPNLKRLLSAIYSISKVRGRKHILKFLAHDACDVEPILHALRLMEEYPEETGLNIQCWNWESIYTLLVWIGMLSLVPFDLNTIDSSSQIAIGSKGLSGTSTSTSTSSTLDKSPTLISSMLMTTRKHLTDSGPTREAAASSLSSLLSRPDLEDSELQDFVIFSSNVLKQYLEFQDCPGSVAKTMSIFLVMGIVQTLAAIFKTGSRSNLMERHLRCVEMLWEQAILVADRAAPKEGKGGGAPLLRKLLAKLFARVGCSYLPPKVAEWRYQRGRRSLLENLGSSGDSNVAGDQLKNAQMQEGGKGCNMDHGCNTDLFRVPDQVEDSMAHLVHSLTDPATTVRWSAAKGIGRVTERLPAICADDVLDAIIELTLDNENDNAWHGACLSIAELARRGLLLPKRLGEVVPIVLRAIHYDVPRGQNSVGSHVRDAACYTCWAFARAYAPVILEPYVPELSKAIVLTSVFDREINCRRSASAAFQECVGRQGADNFKHGISILTAADYFTLGNRTVAYTSVSFYIAGFEEYRPSIIDYLYEDKLFHWDQEIRNLVSISLRGLTKLDPIYFVDNVLPFLVKHATHENLFVRHGAVIGAAEIILALGKEPDGVLSASDSLLSSISELTFSIEKARLYRGRGGEIMREGVSRLIECIAISCVPMTMKQQVGLLDSLDANLKHPKEDIQQAAAKALAAVTRSYFPVGEQGPSERLQKRLVGKYVDAVRNEENPAATRGYSLALGQLPSKLLAPDSRTLDSVIESLCYSSHSRTTISGQGDAETRTNSLGSLIRLCETVGLGHSPDDNVALSPKQVTTVFRALLDATEDYNTDRRGDVGSWCRIAAMVALEKLMYLAIEASDIPQDIAFQNINSPNALRQPVVPPLQERFEALEPDAEAKARICFVRNESVRGETKTNPSIFFDAELCSEIIGSMLKQLSEKLDVVRNQAGVCLEAILTNKKTLVPFVYSRQNLVEALLLQNETNWSNPESTFPLVMRAINIDEFFHGILSGIVISVGGLTQSVTKQSSKSFLEYTKALKATKQISKLSKLGNGKSSWIYSYHHCPRSCRSILHHSFVAIYRLNSII